MLRWRCSITPSPRSVPSTANHRRVRHPTDPASGTWGRIVGLTSGSASGFPGEVSYGAAKAAEVSYTLSAATELAPYGSTT